MRKNKIITRKLDETGRIVLPKPYREALGIKIGDDIEITLDEGCIVLKKPQELCVICGNVGTTIFKGVPLCESCVEEIKSNA